MKKAEKKQSYTVAYEELKKILSDLEAGEIDVDELSMKVKRAAELIGHCQKRLKETELEVKKVVEQFEEKWKNNENESA